MKLLWGGNPRVKNRALKKKWRLAEKKERNSRRIRTEEGIKLEVRGTSKLGFSYHMRGSLGGGNRRILYSIGKTNPSLSGGEVIRVRGKTLNVE